MAAEAEGCPVAALIDPNPYLAYARIAKLLHPQTAGRAGNSSDRGRWRRARASRLRRRWGRLAVIEDEAEIGERVRRPRLHRAARRAGRRRHSLLVVAGQSVSAESSSGERCILHAGAVIGADGFGFAPDAGTWVKVPQVGSVRIGDDVEIGANTTIDRGAIDDTVVEHGVKLDNQIQVGHNVTIGAHYRHRRLHGHLRQRQASAGAA